MGKIGHPAFHILSALADGELTADEEALARSHVSACVPCASELRALRTLDGALQRAPAIACAVALPLLSALVDREADGEELALAREHAGSCAPCSALISRWTQVDTAIASLPVALPSESVDNAIRALIAQPARRSGPLAGGGIPAFAGRIAGVTLAAGVFALAVTLLPGAPTAPRDQAIDVTAFGTARHMLFDPRTNTVFVADPQAGSVTAVDATTRQIRATFTVGGRPSALALNPVTHMLLVLDSTNKTLSEVDTSLGTVLSTSSVASRGTPTAIQVDASGSKITVFSAVTPASAQPQRTEGPDSGEVTVLDARTKAVEAVRSVEVAPQTVVLAPDGTRALLVSTGSTSVVDPATYSEKQRLPGGVDGSFSRDGKLIAVLSGTGNAPRVLYFGDASPADVRLEGRPIAITSVGERGFAVLLEHRDKGRIVVLSNDGSPEPMTLEVELVGRALVYDQATRAFTVIGDRSVLVAQLPSAGVAIATPAPTAPPVAIAASTPAPSAPAASAAPSAPASATPSAPVAQPASPALFAQVPTRADQRPRLTATRGHELWFVDQRNMLSVLDTSDGTTAAIAQLPAGELIEALAVGPKHVFAADVSGGRLLAVSRTGAVTTIAVPMRSRVLLTASVDGRAWMAFTGVGDLTSVDPVSGRIELVNVSKGEVTQVSTDAAGLLWFTTDQGVLGSYDSRGRRLVEYRPAFRGVVTELLAVRNGTIWLGTSTGEVLRVEHGRTVRSESVGGQVTDLVLDAWERPWYLVPAPAGSTAGMVGGTPYGSVAGPVTGLITDPEGRPWLADARGAFWKPVP